MTIPPAAPSPSVDSFRHEAFFYSGETEFVERTSSFVRDGLDAGQAVLVAVVAPKIDRIKSALGPDSDRVLFADMDEVGRNPARIIPLWRDFVDRNGFPGRSVRGIGEPIWAARTPDELVESQRHEALLNLAFAQDPAWILCPYDTVSLGREILAEAERSHPYRTYGSGDKDETTSLPHEEWSAPFDRPLAESPQAAQSLEITKDSLHKVRALVYQEAAKSGMDAAKSFDLVLAVNEIATNSIRHGGGTGTLRIWDEGSSLVCEVSDGAHSQISEPLIGRERPKSGQEGGFGLWMVNQLCDLVQIRSFPTASVVRVHMRHP